MLITIAGPQSSGKTTIFNLVKQKYPQLNFISEINPYSLVGEKHLGAAFVSSDLEIKITEKELVILNPLVNQQKLSIVETGIFHLVYIELHLGKKVAQEYLYKYLKLYNRLNPTIFFIDTKPEISWQRRKEKYEKRIISISDQKQKNKIMTKYNQTLYNLYPLWLKYFELLPFKKIMIKNSFKSKIEFQTEILRKINFVLKSRYVSYSTSKLKQNISHL